MGKGLIHFSQICLCGGFVLIAVSVSEIRQKEQIQAPPLIQDLAQIEAKVQEQRQVLKTKSAAVPRMEQARDLIDAAKNMTSLQDFTRLALKGIERELLDSLLGDEFSQGNPFDSLDNVYPFALMLQKGVRSFSRDAYRSPQFMGGLGYDVVKYEVVHPDQSRSFVLAYKDKTAPAQVAIGRKDSRPVFSLFMVPQDQDQVYMSLFENGRPVTNKVVSMESALAQITARVDSSTLLSSRSPQSVR